MANYIASLPNTVVRINQPQIDRFHSYVTQIVELIDDVRHIEHEQAQAALMHMGQKLADKVRLTTERAESDLKHGQRIAHCNVVTEVNRLAESGDHEMIAAAIVAMQDPNREPESSDEILLGEFLSHLKHRQAVDGASLFMDFERCLNTIHQWVCEYHANVHCTLTPVVA